MSEPKLSYEQRQEVNRLMEEAQDDLEGVLFRLVANLDAAVEALKKSLEELENPSEYQGEVQDGYDADPKVIELVRQTLARLGEGK